MLVGGRTAGAFLGGRPYEILGGRFLLYLAVAPGPEGLDIEGKGVQPDVAVEDPLPYAAGADPRFDRALALAIEAASRR